MNVDCKNFSDAAAKFEKALSSCDFVAVDLEFSGLYGDDAPGPADTIAQRYAKHAAAVRQFGVVQVGLCLFSAGDGAAEAARALG